METQPSNSLLAIFLQYVVPPLLAVVGPLLVVLLTKLVQWLAAKEKESKLAMVGGFFAELAKSAVAEVEATLRPQVQKALADGHVSPEEAAQLKAAAMEILKTKAPPALLQQAQATFGGALDAWLGGLVERANKTVNEAPPNP